MSNNINGGGRSRNMLSSVDFYRRVPRDLTEVSLNPLARNNEALLGRFGDISCRTNRTTGVASTLRLVLHWAFVLKILDSVVSIIAVSMHLSYFAILSLSPFARNNEYEY